ncbi:MAG: hypothetical protein GXP45_03035 [bacterium]|nr:hypothetical protein [bacterium]
MTGRNFKECIRTGKKIEYIEPVVWEIDTQNLNTEELEKINEEKGKAVSSYIFLNDQDGKDIIRKKTYYHITLTPDKDKNNKVIKIASMSADVTKEELDRQEKEEQRIKIAFINDQINASIKYGKKIQTAMLPSAEEMALL